MVRDDMERRMATLSRTGTELSSTSANPRWTKLLAVAGQELSTEAGIASVSDVRVSPFVESKWDQSTVSGMNVYNYYTPNNYVCGCVATALAQVLRFHQAPIAGVGTTSFTIWVDNVSEMRSIRGGDGNGGAYNWAEMPLVPDASITDTQRQAIGALTHDAGVSVGMNYTSGGSGSDTLQTGVSLLDTFAYTGAVRGYQSGSSLDDSLRNTMVNPNLDAGLPVILGITGASGGHAIVTDGYGYQDSTLYHHLNMGWSGAYNVWYNLPTIETFVNFDSVYKVIYNISPLVSGEIISGRVLDGDGNPVSGVAIEGFGDLDVYTDTTDDNGVYALIGLPSDMQVYIEATKSGYTIPSLRVTTGTSAFAGYGSTSTCGNIWGADLTANAASSSVNIVPCIMPIMN